MSSARSSAAGLDLESAAVSLDQIFATAEDPMFVRDGAARVLRANDCYTLAFLGAPASDVVGRTLYEFRPRESVDELNAMHGETLSNGASITTAMLHGRYVRVEAWAVRIEGTDGALLGRVRLPDPVAEARRRLMPAGNSASAVRLERKVADLGVLASLTMRELHLMRLLAAGSPPEDVCVHLGLTTSQLDRKMDRVGAKLGVHDPQTLRVHAYERGLHLFSDRYWNETVLPRTAGG
ncbi:MAG TPA: PAS domain-containing protein [Phycisphaerales bacterium]|nr:PAS domain-containing protein [Phycisphaerales bacterium]